MIITLADVISVNVRRQAGIISTIIESFRYSIIIGCFAGVTSEIGIIDIATRYCSKILHSKIRIIDIPLTDAVRYLKLLI